MNTGKISILFREKQAWRQSLQAFGNIQLLSSAMEVIEENLLHKD